jgi:hypothetical protein
MFMGIGAALISTWGIVLMLKERGRLPGQDEQRLLLL